MRRCAAWVLLVLAALALRAWRLYGDFNADEVWILSLMSLPAASMRAELVVDWTHPPLYYVALRGWCAVAGASGDALRWFSVLCGTATVAALVGFGRTVRVPHAGWLAAALLALSPAHIFYSQMARSWVWVTLWTVLAWWTTAGWIATRRAAWLAAAMISAVVLALSNYLGWGALGVLAGWVLWESRHVPVLRRWYWGLGAAALATGCWLAMVWPTMQQHGTEGYLDWVPPTTLISAAIQLGRLFGRIPLPSFLRLELLLWSVVGLWGLWAYASRRGRSEPAWIWLGAGVPWLWMSFWLGGVAGLPTWVVRFLLPLLPVYYLAVAWALRVWLRPLARGLMVGVLLAWNAGACWALQHATRRLPFDTLAATIALEPQEVPVVIDRTYLMNPLLHASARGRERFLVVDARSTLLPEAQEIALEEIPRAPRVLVAGADRLFRDEVAQALGPGYALRPIARLFGWGQEMEPKTIWLVAYERQAGTE